MPAVFSLEIVAQRDWEHPVESWREIVSVTGETQSG